MKVDYCNGTAATDVVKQHFIHYLLILMLSAFPAFGQSEKKFPVGDAATIELPSTWKLVQAKGAALTATDSQEIMTIVILQENGKAIEVKNLEEYQDAKIHNIKNSNSLTDAVSAAIKQGKVDKLTSAFTTMTGNLDVDGKKTPVKIYLMMYDAGNGDYYFAMVTAPAAQFDANASAFMKILRSFRVH